MFAERTERLSFKVSVIMPVKTTTDQRPDYWSETKINQTKINNPMMQNRYYSEKKSVSSEPYKTR